MYSLKKIGKKLEEVIENDQFVFRIRKGTTDGIGLMRILSISVVDVKEETSLLH